MHGPGAWRGGNVELTEWLDLFLIPGVLLGGVYWLHQQIKAEGKAVREEAKTAHENIGKNIDQVRDTLGASIGHVREDVKRVDLKVDELAKETRNLHRAVGQLEGTVGRVGRQDP